jgi:secondary thiamine-phosphate synthase enzyme
MPELTFQTNRRQELLDITVAVREAVNDIFCDAVLVYSPHTTAGIFVNEHADPDVARDILVALDAMVPDAGIYRHGEGNSPAHVKAVIVGTSQLIPFRDGRPALGTWQGIFLAEFDGPRRRRVLVSPIGMRR